MVHNDSEVIPLAGLEQRHVRHWHFYCDIAKGRLVEFTSALGGQKFIVNDDDMRATPGPGIVVRATWTATRLSSGRSGQGTAVAAVRM